VEVEIFYLEGEIFKISPIQTTRVTKNIKACKMKKQSIKPAFCVLKNLAV